MKYVAPAFRFSPATHKRLNQIRLNVAIVSLVMVRLFSPMIHEVFWQDLLLIYNIFAWITILTVDSSRLPEFTTTRIQQKQSWIMAGKISPLILGGCVGAVYVLHVPIHVPKLLLASLFSMLIGAYLDELLFRNILQPRLRKLGLTPWLSIIMQSLIYAISFAFYKEPLGIVICALFLGIANGWLVYKFRSLWAAFALSVVWHILLV